MPERAINSAPSDTDFGVRSGFALVPQAQMQLESAFGQPGMALGPGALLKGGRYRLMQPLQTTTNLQQRASDPPLMIASDTEMANQRVLIQEVALSASTAEEAEGLRRMLVMRYQELSGDAHVPSMLDNFSDRRRHFLVFEYPSGDLLLDRLTRAHGPLDENTSIGIALRVLDVLMTFERQYPPLVHGNICPANVILRPGGQVALVGISPALLLHPEGNVEHGMAGGIPGYAAPEQARGQASPRSDIYALCAVLHHCVTGAAPTPRIGAAHPQARHLNPKVSLELEEVLSQGLRPSSTQRYSTAADLRLALLPLASGRRLTHVSEDVRDDSASDATAAPLRDARGRLALPRRRLTQNPLLILGCVLLLVLLVGGGLLYSFLPRTKTPTGSTISTFTNGNTAQLYQQGIGLSGGDEVFDTQIPDNALKEQGALALAGGDTHKALTAYQNAFYLNPPDAEAAIYAADLQVTLSKAPFITIVAAVAFGDDDIAARAQLQGIYLAQQRVNSFATLPGGLKLRVLILNSGQDPSASGTAAQLVIAQLHQGNPQHIIGIVGWPSSAQTDAAFTTLGGNSLAIIGPTASADILSHNDGDYFSLVPYDSQQAAQLADTAITQLKAQHILVLGDPKDSVSSAIAASFINEADSSKYAGQGIAATRQSYTIGSTDFAAIAQTAASQGDSLIFLASGQANGPSDAIALAHSVTKANATYGASMHVLLDSYGFTAALLGIGDPTDTTVAAAAADPAALSVLYPVTPAYTSEWASIGLKDSAFDIFPFNYADQLGSGSEPDGMNSPDAATMLSYDAMHVLLAAATQALRAAPITPATATASSVSTTRFPDPAQVLAALYHFNAQHPFIGISGAISFTSTGAAPTKPLVILSITALPGAGSGASTPTGTAVAQVNILAVTGGVALFCGSAGADCGPS